MKIAELMIIAGLGSAALFTGMCLQASFTNEKDSQQQVSDVPVIVACNIYNMADKQVDLLCHLRVKDEWLRAYKPTNPPTQMQPPVVRKEQSKWSISYQL